MDMEGVATVSVPKKKALKKNGRLRRGCRFSGRGARCTPEVARSLGIGGSKRKKGRKGRKSRKGGRRGMPNLRPKTAQAAQNKALFDALMNRRRAFKGALKAGSCSSARLYGRDLIGVLKRLSQLPSPSRERMMKRNKRYNSEAAGVALKAGNICKGIPAQFQGVKGGKKGGHPCASPRPPAWCNKKR